MMQDKSIPLLDCPVDYLVGDASGKVMNDYGRFPCKIKCGVYAMMVRGHARATLNITQYDFNENDVLLLEPGTFLLIHEISADALVYYVLFSSSFLEKNTFTMRMTLDSLQPRSPILHLQQDKADLLKKSAELLFQASNTQPSSLNTEMMVHVFNILQISYVAYAKRNKEYIEHTMDRRTEICSEYKRLVIAHYHEWHHVKQYADQMHMTMPHLCSTIKAVCGRTAGDIIDEALMTDARAQLKITNLQIKEIAVNLGFENVAFFNRFFKTHIGVTPKVYRMS